MRHRTLDFGRAWPSLLPVLLLSVVGILHAVRVRARHLSPWKGGGFGMFSTIDATRERMVRVVHRPGDGREEVIDLVAGRLWDEGWSSVRAEPTPEKLRAALRRAAPRVAVTGERRGRLVGQVWRLAFERRSRALTRALIAEASLDLSRP